MEQIRADICVIGGGSGGLMVAAGAARLGASTVLIEPGPMGGDCLNYGCVPSKALLAAGKRAAAFRGSTAFGIEATDPVVDFAAVADHVAEVIAGIASHDSVERFESLGVRVLTARARFTGPKEVEAGDHRITARRFVIATGSRPSVPPIPGLDQTPFFTNETLFANRELPNHLIILGGGPVGVEMADAHRNLGADVTIIEQAKVLAGEDPELSAVLIDRLKANGVRFLGATKVTHVESLESRDGRVRVSCRTGSETQDLTGSHLLVAVGRAANVDGLGLEAAGVQYSATGITVSPGLRTSNRKIYAIGDVTGGPQFTHAANYQAGIVLRSALFRLPAKVRPGAIPRVLFTDPELAQAGMTEAEARKEYGDAIRVVRWPFAENDRARTERRTGGLVKAVTTRRGRILGAGIAGAHAGELIQPWCMALSAGKRISALRGFVAPYPTLGEASGRAAGTFYEDALFGPWSRRMVAFLSKFG